MVHLNKKQNLQQIQKLVETKMDTQYRKNRKKKTKNQTSKKKQLMKKTPEKCKTIPFILERGLWL